MNEIEPPRPIDRSRYTVREIAEAIFRDADQSWPIEAAALLIAEHDHWLHRPEFLKFVMTGKVDDEEWIGIDWKAVAQALRHEAIGGEVPDLNILRIGASIAAYGDDVSLREVTANQSPRAMRAIVKAIMHAGGYVDGIG